MSSAPIILWIRRDFRLSDNAALAAAAATGRPIIPLFILDPATASIGAAPRWRLEQAIVRFTQTLSESGSRLILRRGDAVQVLRDLVAQTGADTVYWSRAYQPDIIDRDKTLKATLQEQGLTAKSFAGWLLFEPWTVKTGQGGFYSVYTPFWKNVRTREVPPAFPAPDKISVPDLWPDSDNLAKWQLGADMRRGADIVAKHARVGEAAALARLEDFAHEALDGYTEDRNRPDLNGTSGLSENLALGEISPRTVWHRAYRAMQDGNPGAETFLKEIVWREFAWHLTWHTPHIASRNWREGWDDFPWRGDNSDAEKWRRGQTGEPIVDAGMRELYVTGRMHNRVRMIVASYLTKHLLIDWRVGRDWFEHCLIDWDPASNAMGWQWVAGSGPDASPYFRIFNPATQADKFDPKGNYRAQYLSGDGASDFAAAIPLAWGQTKCPDQPIIDLATGRTRALDAYQSSKS